MNQNILENFRNLKLLRNKTNQTERFDMVLIKFHDNDFHSTFQPLLESVLNYLAWNACHTTPVPDTFIEDIIRGGIEYHYRYFQIGTRVDSRLQHINSTIEYLNGIKVLFKESLSR